MKGWYAAAGRYEDYLRRHENSHILLIELGVGMNTPVIIKYPFWQMTANNKDATYVCINRSEAYCPEDIADRSICIDADIGKTISDVLKAKV